MNKQISKKLAAAMEFLREDPSVKGGIIMLFDEEGVAVDLDGKIPVAVACTNLMSELIKGKDFDESVDLLSSCCAIAMAGRDSLGDKK